MSVCFYIWFNYITTKTYTMKKVIYLLLIAVLTMSCAVVRPGEAAMKQKFGNLEDKVTTQGTIWYNPFTTRVIKESIQTNNLELLLSLPSKEGLSVASEISILYHLQTEKVPSIIKDIGSNYKSVITNVFRSAAADVCSRFFAKDMHSGRRADIEEEIKIRMDSNLIDQGIVIEAVLLKSIQLPAGLSRSIEQKLQAEQDAMRMEFVLQQERLEAQRKIIEAEGTRDSQIILSEGLTPAIIKIRSIDAFKELAKSNNSKVIITDGKTPYLVSGEEVYDPKK